jgi:hypothetical protein
VLAPIQFKSELEFVTVEIEEVPSEWVLPPELAPVHSTISEEVPKHGFGVRRMPPKRSGKFSLRQASFPELIKDDVDLPTREAIISGSYR